ncbi:TPM domain-containing protein [Aureibaculum sp. 2210JD6-5]|uniref:TPM domain-containing protein n=1 Tax=Aureibaculum sp. 2210JD6-5 TaxID=3103957 RepID=UPI002AAE9BE6|nr:TPM domain-containing protein [Aureibaculum sp. 2210JD6-5]MDY7394914.1 TPM domain-containing protein [Aureibaculum sp. 2210JD6-5]
MSKVEDFLTISQEQEIIEAIRLAEQNTSGEIRVHLETTTDKEPLERAKEVFAFLKMDQTAQQNGVLFYVAVDDKKFSILGDKGIDDAVPNNFWDSIRDIVISEFKKGNYTQGLKQGILETGLKLKHYFPYQNNDKNELPDSISLS